MKTHKEFTDNLRTIVSQVHDGRAKSYAAWKDIYDELYRLRSYADETMNLYLCQQEAADTAKAKAREIEDRETGLP